MALGLDSTALMTCLGRPTVCGGHSGCWGVQGEAPGPHGSSGQTDVSYLTNKCKVAVPTWAVRGCEATGGCDQSGHMSQGAGMGRRYRRQEEGKEGPPGRGPWGGKEHGRLARPGWLGLATRRRRAVPGGLICSPWPPCSSGHPHRHQPVHRVFRRRPPGGAVSPGGEGPPGPGGHPLRLVPGPGLDQLHRRAAHRGRLPGGSPHAPPETAAGAGHLNLEAWSCVVGGRLARGLVDPSR